MSKFGSMGVVNVEPARGFQDNAPDDTTIAAAQAGDQAALETLLRQYGHLVRSRARMYFLLGADAEDVHQEGMIGLLKAIRDFNPSRGGSFSSFATMCITRQIITAIKTATRQKHVPLNGYVSLSKPIYEDGSKSLEEMLTSLAPGPEEEVIRQELSREFSREVAARLSPYEQQVLALYLEGVSFAAIGARFHRGPKSVDNAVWRIKRKLRREFLPGDA